MDANKTPLTSAQQAFLDQMQLNRTDERALKVIKAAMVFRNHSELLDATSTTFAFALDEVTG